MVLPKPRFSKDPGFVFLGRDSEIYVSEVEGGECRIPERILYLPMKMVSSFCIDWIERLEVKSHDLRNVGCFPRSHVVGSYSRKVGRYP